MLVRTEKSMKKALVIRSPSWPGFKQGALKHERDPMRAPI
jgi:hypothetical protein